MIFISFFHGFYYRKNNERRDLGNLIKMLINWLGSEVISWCTRFSKKWLQRRHFFSDPSAIKKSLFWYFPEYILLKTILWDIFLKILFEQLPEQNTPWQSKNYYFDKFLLLKLTHIIWKKLSLFWHWQDEYYGYFMFYKSRSTFY